MKVAILFLFAFVAVSQAAFTVNLVQRVQPILAKTFAQAHLRTRADNELQTTLFQTLSEHASALVEQIQAGITNGVQVAQEVYDSLAQTLSELQNLGSNAYDAVVSIIGNFFSGLSGGNSKRALDLSSITSVLSGLGLDNMLGNLFSYVTGLIAQLQIPEFIQSALSAILSNDVVQQVMAALFGRQRGLFGDLINGLTGAASALAQQVTIFVQQIQGSLATGLASVTQIASQILAEAQNQVATLTNEAAQQLMTALAPYAQDMGDLYTQVVAAINQLVGKNY